MKNTELSYKIFEKVFKNKIAKKAYLEAVKWLAINIISKEQFANNLSYKIQKIKNNAVKISIFLDIDEKELKDKFCDKCKHVYATFYQVQKMNCDECKMNAYRKINEKYIENMCEFYKKILESGEEDEWEDN